MAGRSSDDWEAIDPPPAEARRHRIGPLMRRRLLRLCDRCMRRSCFESGCPTARTWKRHRVTRWRVTSGSR